MTDPGDADLAFADFRELRSLRTTRTLHEKRRDQYARKKIALVPVRSRTQPDTRGIPQSRDRRAVPLWLANNISPTLFWKTTWHNGNDISLLQRSKTLCG